jgi:hypothetical protein
MVGLFDVVFLAVMMLKEKVLQNSNAGLLKLFSKS